MSSQTPVDIVVRGTVVNVLTGSLEDRYVAVDGGEIVGFGDRPARERYEAAYLAPGLINSHMHIESTMLSLPRYGEAVIPHGVTGIVADPHEIGNVLGVDGVRQLTVHADHTPLRVRFTVPSSVPASDLQDTGATIDPADVEQLLATDRIVGLAEVMDIEGVVTDDAAVHAKIEATRKRGLTVDGHMPRVTGNRLQVAARFLDTDHESRALSEAREKVEAGIKIQLRQGSSSKNLEELLPLVDEVDSRRLMLCTDNFYINDLQEHGGIDESVRMMIEYGVDPVEAVQLATINVAETYGLPYGRIAPGAPADIVLLDDLETWDVDAVMVDGVIDPVADVTDPPRYELDHNTVDVDRLDPSDFAYPAPHDGPCRIRAIDHTGEVPTERVETVPVADRVLAPNPEEDLLPVAVVERHGKGGGIGKGFVHGFALERGALASTIAHDAHNLVVVGASHRAMAEAANELRDVGGGLTVFDPENGTTTLPLPVAGLISERPVSVVAEQFKAVQTATRELGTELAGGIMELDTLTLEVIPELRITNHGLVDVEQMELVDLLVAGSDEE
jgi:adenine deaminase